MHIPLLRMPCMRSAAPHLLASSMHFILPHPPGCTIGAPTSAAIVLRALSWPALATSAWCILPDHPCCTIGGPTSAANAIHGRSAGPRLLHTYLISVLPHHLCCRIGAPTSVALPFGTFERVLADPVNKEVAAQVAAAEKELVSQPFFRELVPPKCWFSMY